MRVTLIPTSGRSRQAARARPHFRARIVEADRPKGWVASVHSHRVAAFYQMKTLDVVWSLDQTQRDFFIVDVLAHVRHAKRLVGA